MSMQNYKLLLGLFGLLLFSAPAFAQNNSPSMSAMVHMKQVTVQVVMENEEPSPSGIIRLHGECSQCGKDLRFKRGTRLVTPFYEGPMNMEELYKFRLAKARVILNTSSETITDILYVERGF